MLNLSLKIVKQDEHGVLMRVVLDFLGYSLVNSEVYFNPELNSEWVKDIDLIRWYYKTSRK